MLQVKLLSDGNGSEYVVWLGHLQVLVIKDALLSMLAVFQVCCSVVQCVVV